MARRFSVVMLLGEPALFSDVRIPAEELPPDMYKYDIRHGDNGEFLTVEPQVYVNHAATVIRMNPLNFTHNGYISLTGKAAPNFLGFDADIDGFREYCQQNAVDNAVIEAGEYLGFRVTVIESEEYPDGNFSPRQYEFEGWSEAGENLIFEVDCEDVVKRLAENALDFDVEDHVRMWLNAKEHGTSGIPNVQKLVEDATEIKAKYYELYMRVDSAISKLQEPSRTNQVTFDVYYLDVYEEEHGLWIENQRFRLGDLRVKAFLDGEIDEDDILAAMSRFVYFDLTGRELHALYPKDVKKVYIDKTGISNGWYEVCQRDNDMPIYGLQLKDVG